MTKTKRQLHGKPAGVGAQTHVIGGGNLCFSFPNGFAPDDPTRIAAQTVSGAGVALGFGYQLIALLTTVSAVFISRIPKIGHYE